MIEPPTQLRDVMFDRTEQYRKRPIRVYYDKTKKVFCWLSSYSVSHPIEGEAKTSEAAFAAARKVIDELEPNAN